MGQRKGQLFLYIVFIITRLNVGMAFGQDDCKLPPLGTVSFYRHMFFLILDNCQNPIRTSLPNCVFEFSDYPQETCTGINYSYEPGEDGSTGDCYVCLAHSSHSFTDMPGGMIWKTCSTYTSEISLLSRESYDQPLRIDMSNPSGLFHGQVIMMQVIPDTADAMLLVFTTSPDFDDDAGNMKEMDFFVQAKFDVDYGYNPNGIVVNTFSEGFQTWVVVPAVVPIAEYMSIGSDCNWVIFVTESQYSFYIDGKLVTRFTRVANLPLSSFMYFSVSYHFKVLRWMDTIWE